MQQQLSNDPCVHKDSSASEASAIEKEEKTSTTQLRHRVPAASSDRQCPPSSRSDEQIEQITDRNILAARAVLEILSAAIGVAMMWFIADD